MIEVKHREHDGRGAFYVEQGGKQVAEMVYHRDDASKITIVHTEVDDSLRGQGVARKLLDGAVAWARETKTRVAATCPYAKKQFETDPSIGDVRA